MSLISQFVTHFWSECLWGLWDSRELFSLYYLNSKVRRVGMLVRRVWSAGCRVLSSSGTKTRNTHTSWTCVPHICWNTYVCV